MTASLTAIDILRRLVGFDTVSSNSNLALIGWVADYLDSYGIPVHLTYGEAEQKANLFATIGPAGRGGIILSGHTDVVPVSGQDWTGDPFVLRAAEDKLFGRGTADMKGFIAIALSLVPEMLRSGLRQPLHLALSFDEEVGCRGAPLLIADLPEGAARPLLAIIGEPTSMQVVTAHKGVEVFTTVIHGQPAHSSAPDRGLNAIIAAGEMIQLVAGLAEAAKTRAQPASGFEPPFTTFNIGTIAGGTALNIVAAECSLTWEFRAMPSEDPAEIRAEIERFLMADLLPRLRARHPSARVETRQIAEVPRLAPTPGSPAETLALQLTGAEQTATIAFATEGGLFQRAGIPAIVCGPGSIEQAHRADEFITLEQLAAGTAFQHRLIAWASNTQP